MSSTTNFLSISQSSAGLIRRAVGKRLAQAMESRDIDRVEMAQMLNTSELRLCRILKGSSDMTAAELVWAAKVLDIPVDTIAGAWRA